MGNTNLGSSQEDPPPPNPTTEWTQRADGPNFFRDGENVHFIRADSLGKHEFVEGTLRLLVRTKRLWHRTCQTHDSVMHQFTDAVGPCAEIRMEISFFTSDIFRVKFAADEDGLNEANDDPAFPPAEWRMLVGKKQDIETRFEQLCDSLLLHSPTVTINVQSKPFRIVAYRHGSKVPFWKQRLSDLFTSDVIPMSIATHCGRQGMFESFALDPNECIYGLGERFDAVERRGRPVDFVNHDAIGTSNRRSYINVPFFWSTKGYGCFVNSNARTEWDIGMSEAGSIGFATEENYMDYFILSGATPSEILRRYTNDLTGVSPVPPIWTFGLWLSRNSYQSWAVVDEVIKKADMHGIPFDTVHLDTSWFHEDWNPDLIFSQERFPQPEMKMKTLAQEGIHVSLWQYNFVPPREDNVLYSEGREGGYFGKKSGEKDGMNNEFYQYPQGTAGWKTDDLVIDFSNPAAVRWYGKKISRLIEQGASAIKTDFGDCIPPAAHYLNISGRKFQNLYSLVYNSVIRAAVAQANPNTAQWARSGTAGSQRYPIHWGGDSQCSWSGLQGSVRAMLSLGLSGFAFFSHDIGGFIGTPESELYIRWAQIGLLSSHARIHGAGDENGREPWYFGDEAVRIFRKFAQLRLVRQSQPSWCFFSLTSVVGMRCCLILCSRRSKARKPASHL